MKYRLLLLLIAAITASSLRAANLFILYDDACMDRLEYAYANSPDSEPYIVYHVNSPASPGEKIVLEVGPESQTPQDFTPAQLIRCNNTVFDEKLVNAINSNIDRVQIVVKKGNRYFLSPITFAARYLASEDFILYDSPKYRFQFDRKMGAVGENIAYRNPRAKVSFEGKLENVCSGAFLFHQYAEFEGNPHTDIVLIPEVGVVEERSGINTEDALSNTLRLERVNGRTLDRHLRKLCQGIDNDPPASPGGDEFTRRAAQGEFYTVGGEQARPAEYSSKAYTAPVDPLAGQTLPSPAPAAQQPKTHQVKKGETLYRISKNYGVSVDQIRTWNQKGNSNAIFPGEELKVSEPVARQDQLAAKSAAPQPGLAPRPSAYESSSNRIPTAQTSQQAADYHTVRPGETLASLAMRYGYTEERFREINGLGEREMIKIGQRLKTTDCEPAQQPPVPASYERQASARIPAYSEPGFQSRSATVGTTATQARPATSARPNSPTAYESFSEDRFGQPAAVQYQENYRNTPYFLDRPATATPSPSAYNQPSERIGAQPQYYQDQPQSYNAPETDMRTRSAQPQYDTFVQLQRSNRSVYIVKDGDTLFSIARNYGTSVERLRDLNNLALNEVLIPYQRIYLN